jgi:hypothetical protein
MTKAKERVSFSTLTIAVSEPESRKPALYPVKHVETSSRTIQNAQPAIPYANWNLPKQEEGYIKGKAHDFL